MNASLRSAAIDAVRAASLVCRRVQRELVDATLTKQDRSPVTVADFAAQAVISSILAERTPGVPIVGEESSDALRADDEEAAALREKVVAAVRSVEATAELSSDQVLDAIDRCCDGGGAHGSRWVLDPIDGTKGYLRGDQYAVALGLLDGGAVRLGVLGCPNLDAHDGSLGALFVAERGEGTSQLALEGDASKTARVTRVDDPSRANFCESVESAHSAHDRHQAIAEHLGTDAEPFQIDSQCKYAAVSRGQASIYLRLPTSTTYQEKIWDHAAGSIVVEEAGGRVTDVNGRDLDFSLGRTLASNRGIVATNGLLHDRVLEAIRATAPES